MKIYSPLERKRAEGSPAAPLENSIAAAQSTLEPSQGQALHPEAPEDPGPFPVEALNPILREIVQSVAAVHGVPVELHTLEKEAGDPGRRGVILYLHGGAFCLGSPATHRSITTRLARDAGLAERVSFVGGGADVRPYYAAADLLVLPTHYDPFPNVVPEALAMGVPAIVSDQCGAD